GVAYGDAFDVALVDQRTLEGDPGRRVVAPVVGSIHHHALGQVRRGVAFIEGQVDVRIAERVPEEPIGDGDGAVDPARVRVEQQLVGVEPMAFARRVRTLDAEPVALAWPQVGEVAVPYEV